MSFAEQLPDHSPPPAPRRTQLRLVSVQSREQYLAPDPAAALAPARGMALGVMLSLGLFWAPVAAAWWLLQ